MTEKTKELINDIFGYIAIAFLLIIPFVLSVMLFNEKQKNTEIVANYSQSVIESALEASNYEMAYEMLGDFYEIREQELKELKQENKELYDVYMQAIYRYQYTDDYQRLLTAIDEKLSESDYDTLADDMDRYDMIIDQFGSLENFYRYNQGMISLYDDYCGQLTNGTYAISDFYDYIELTEPAFYEWLNDMYNLE